MTKLPDVEGYKLHCIEASGITESSAKKLQSGDDIANPDMATKVSGTSSPTVRLITFSINVSKFSSLNL